MRGFSLIELVLVICILAVLAGVGLPRLAESAARARVDAAARRIATDLRLAQTRARQSSTAQTVIFDLLTHQCRFPGMTNPDRPGTTYTVALADAPYHARIVRADFAGDAELTFDGYGAPDSGGTVIIQCGGHARSITVAEESGAITIYTVPPVSRDALIKTPAR